MTDLERPPANARGVTASAASALRVYQAYRAAGSTISADGRSVEFFGVLRAGPSGTESAVRAIPGAREALARVSRAVGAEAYGVAGADAVSYDVFHTSSSDLGHIIPVVLVIVAGLLALLLQSLVAPWYLIATVGLSYLASLGFASVLFIDVLGEAGLNYVLPFLMFVFSMALGEDYNILLMSRIREEVAQSGSVARGVTRAVGVTGGTLTSAGVILAGTFAILAAVGGNSQAQQIGVALAFGVLLDTFFVRTLLVPSIVQILGPRNWWPSPIRRNLT